MDDEQRQRIEKLDRLLTTEFQRLGPLAWIRTDDRRLWMPCIEEEIDPRTGLLKPVFRHEQTATGIWVARTVTKLQPIMPKFQGGETNEPLWCLCKTEQVDEDIWKQMFGTLEDFPGIQWVPVYTDKHQTVPLHLTSEPTETDTWDMITFLRSTQEPVVGQFAYEYRRSSERLRKKTIADNAYVFKHTLAALGRVPHDAGTRNGAVSFPSTSEPKESHESHAQSRD